jgi:hypothetical protein
MVNRYYIGISSPPSKYNVIAFKIYFFVLLSKNTGQSCGTLVKYVVLILPFIHLLLGEFPHY